MNELCCCKVDCDKQADFEIKINDSPDGYTHACVDHVGELLFEGVNTVYVI